MGRIEKKKLSQFPGTSAVTHSSTRLIPVPQTRYNPTAKQDDWEEVAPIEFGSIKLTDAANRTWTGPHGYDSKVLNYNGVGTTISCRMSVRQTFQTFPRAISLSPLSHSFPGARSES